VRLGSWKPPLFRLLTASSGVKGKPVCKVIIALARQSRVIGASQRGLPGAADRIARSRQRAARCQRETARGCRARCKYPAARRAGLVDR